MNSNDRITAFGEKSVTGFETVDTLNGLPQLQNLPDDVLILLENGQIDEALALLAMLQNPSEDKMLFLAKMGENIMWAITLPMQMILKFVQANRKKGKVTEVQKAHASAQNHSSDALRFFKTLFVKPFQKPVKKIVQLVNQTALYALKGAKLLYNGIYHTAKFAAKHVKTSLETVKEKSAQVADLVKSLALPALELARKVFQKAYNKLVEPVSKLAELSDSVFKKLGEVSQQIVTPVVHALAVPFQQLTLGLYKVAEFSMKQAVKNLKKGFEWVKKKSQSTIKLLKTVFIEIPAEVASYFLEWLYQLVMKLLKALAKLWMKVVGLVSILWELAKFSKKLGVMLYQHLSK